MNNQAEHNRKEMYLLTLNKLDYLQETITELKIELEELYSDADKQRNSPNEGVKY